MALTAASRGSEIAILDIRFMHKSETSITFMFNKLFKSWKKGKAPPSLVFNSFEEDKSLCVVSCLNHYLQATQSWRLEPNQNQLLLSFVSPHRAVVKSTIAGWIKNVLIASGVDTNVFKPHSTRSASTSKVNSKISGSGLSLKDILKRENWSNENTWQKFYNKTIKTTETKFENILLSK